MNAPSGAGRGKNGGLKVRGNVKWSDVDTASMHDASVDGNIYKSSVHNYGGKVMIRVCPQIVYISNTRFIFYKKVLYKKARLRKAHQGNILSF